MPIFRLLAVCCLSLALASAATAQSWPNSTDPAHRTDRTGRGDGHHGASPGRRHHAKGRAAGDRREHARGFRHRRASGRRARRARRPYAPFHQHIGHGDQSRLLQAAAIRSDARFHARGDGVQSRAADAVGECRPPDQDRPRAARLRQGEPRQAFDRVRYHRRSSGVWREAAQSPRRSRPGRSALPIGGADDAGRRERRQSGDDELDRRRRGHGSGRQGAPPRGDVRRNASPDCRIFHPSARRCRASS